MFLLGMKTYKELEALSSPLRTEESSVNQAMRHLLQAPFLPFHNAHALGFHLKNSLLPPA